MICHRFILLARGEANVERMAYLLALEKQVDNAALNIQRAGHVRLGTTWPVTASVPKEAAGF